MFSGMKDFIKRKEAFNQCNFRIVQAIAEEMVKRDKDPDSKEAKSRALTTCALEAMDKYIRFFDETDYMYRAGFHSSGIKRVKEAQAILKKFPERHDVITNILSQGRENKDSFKTVFFHHMIDMFCDEQQRIQLSKNFEEIRPYNKKYAEADNYTLYKDFLSSVLAAVEKQRSYISTIELSSIPSRNVSR
jgi:hypothetical protein